MKGIIGPVAAAWDEKAHRLDLFYITTWILQWSGEARRWVRISDGSKPVIQAAERLLQNLEIRDLDFLALMTAEWAIKQFPMATPASWVTQLSQKAEELAADPRNSEEMADLGLLLFGLAATAGVDLRRAIEEKLAKNKARTWGAPDAEGVVEHIAEGGDVPE